MSLPSSYAGLWLGGLASLVLSGGLSRWGIGLSGPEGWPLWSGRAAGGVASLV